MNNTTHTNWHIEYHQLSSLPVKIRMGYFKESDVYPFVGNVLYLPGLSDSMLNHQPLFSCLSTAGFRVISFDYMGQGGSQGSMNNTRIISRRPENTISFLANIAWDKFKTGNNDKKSVIGWSTGGLAAYEMAHRKAANKVVMLAPGLGIKPLMGGHVKTSEKILISDAFLNRQNPHIDPVKPASPLLVPAFSLHLLKVSLQASKWKIDSNVQGMVLLSSEHDTYVNPEKTRKIIQQNAPHFHIKQYDSAFHELDNEKPEIIHSMHQEIAQFLIK